MELRQTKYELTWFEKQGDALIGECPVAGISLSELQKLFKQSPDDPMVYCYPVSPSQVEYLQKFVIHKIDLELYDYFVKPYKSS